MARLGGPQLALGGRRLQRADRVELERPHDALAVGRRDALRCPWRAAHQLGVQRLRPRGRPRPPPARADLRRRRWLEVEVRKRGAQVQAGPPTTIGTAPCAIRPSISACASCANSPALQRASIGRKLRRRCSSRRCSAALAAAGEDFEPGVELHASRTPPPGARRARAGGGRWHGNCGLPHPGRPKRARTSELRLGHRPSIVRSMGVRISAAATTDPARGPGPSKAAQRARRHSTAAGAISPSSSPQGTISPRPSNARGRRRGARPTAARALRRRRRARGRPRIEDGTGRGGLGGGPRRRRAEVSTSRRRRTGRHGRSSGWPTDEPEAIVLLPIRTRSRRMRSWELGDVPVLGGISSARTLDGSRSAVLRERGQADGAVGVASKASISTRRVAGAAPVGPEMTTRPLRGT